MYDATPLKLASKIGLQKSHVTRVYTVVRNELFEMIDRYFDISERKSNKYIVLNHFWKTAQFAGVNRIGSYDREKLKTALDYLLLNSFVRFGPQVFKQIKGIPMVGNASPPIADLFLANLEFRDMDKLVSSKSPENLRMAKKLTLSGSSPFFG